jgi:hypothetical protein
MGPKNVGTPGAPLSSAPLSAPTPPAPAGRRHAAAIVRNPAAAVVAILVGGVAVAGTIGADLRWLDALGRFIVEDGSIPDGVPFATAPSDGWPNVLALAELVLHGVGATLGDRGFLAAQLFAVGGGLAILAVDSRRESASDAGTALALLVVGLGSVAALLVVRLQLFSLLLFPALLALLRADARRPSRRIWLLVPLVALWSNLHGAVLAGVAVAGSYLLLGRARRDPLLAGGVLVATIAAVCITPGLAETPEYFYGVLRNEAAQRGFGLWEPLSPTAPLDLVLVAAAVLLVALAVRARPDLWELVAMAGLALLTIRTGRSGVWLLMLAAAPAARALRLHASVRPAVSALAFGVAAAAVALGLARGPIETGASDRIVETALARARGTPILAEPQLAEQVAAAGGLISIGNPLDAFRHDDQRLYLDWLEGEAAGDRLLGRARVVLVLDGSDAERRLLETSRFSRVASDGDATVYQR